MSFRKNQDVVSFYNRELITIEVEGECFIAMKPVVEGMGLDWDAQRRKIKDSGRYGDTTLPLQTVGGLQEMVCIPLTKLSGWLFSINPEKVNEDRRESVIRYQEECFEVLHNHWVKRVQAPQEQLSGQPSQTLVDSMFVADAVAKMLRMDDSSKLKMTYKVCQDNQVPTGFLPDYVDDDITQSLTTLLKQHDATIGAKTANKILEELGILETLTRPSTKKEGEKRPFKSLTEAGLKYGKNLISPHNPKETQPHYYAKTFPELLDMINKVLQEDVD